MSATTKATVVSTEYTPNPNALKFNLSEQVVSRGAVTYSSPEQAENNRLAAYLLAVPHVTEVFMMDRFITITQDGGMPWDTLISTVKPLIEEHFEPVQVEEKSPEAPGAPLAGGKPWAEMTVVDQVKTIESILDVEIRPALAGDGGGLEVVDLDEFQLKILYQGACGTCPSSISGTLMYIENLLREQLDPRISVSPVDGGFGGF